MIIGQDANAVVPVTPENHEPSSDDPWVKNVLEIGEIVEVWLPSTVAAPTVADPDVEIENVSRFQKNPITSDKVRLPT